MGAWGPGNFENDTVADWLSELQEWSSVEDALSAVLNAPAGAHISANDCSVALGAAELVAACLGRPGRLPAVALEWLAARKGQCDERLRGMADSCARKIERGSELQELFDEGGRYAAWHATVEDLLRRLQRE